IVSRLHRAGLNDAAISSLSCESLCALVRGRSYDPGSDRSLARMIRRYLDYLHCRPTSGSPVDLSGILVVPLLPRPRQSTKDRIISYIKLHGGSWVNAAVLSQRFNVYTHTLLSLLSECNSIEISRPSDYRDSVRYRYVSPEDSA
ncbi:MAG TPA: hypothetical protein O0X27_05655, partial [Methanocorpusculum sp.]|nr:hypothetical protein [Methanocorpusculum sp.]